jgi:Zn-dependent protease
MRFPSFDFAKDAFDVGRFGRAPIELHASFFIVALALTYQFWTSGRLAGLVLTVVGIAVIFASILMHELAHAVFARRYNIPVAGIVIDALGGTVLFGWRPPRLSQDIALTFAGPASNLVLVALCYVLLLLLPDPEPFLVRYMPFEPLSLLDRALSYAMYINLALGLINLLPAFPLDGGWIAYRVLTERLGRRNAGIAVASLGIALATISTVVLFASLLAGLAIYAPPDYHSNLDALRTARRGEEIVI